MTDTAPTAGKPAGWAALIWPFTRIDNAATAQRAFEFSACMLLINALKSALSTMWSYLNMAQIQEFMHNMMAAQATAKGMAPEQLTMVQNMADASLKFGLYFGAALVVIYIIAALVQWRRPTGWIPLVMAIFSVIGILGFLRSLPMLLGHQTPTPAWVAYASVVVTVISLGVYINAFRAKRFVGDQ